MRRFDDPARLGALMMAIAPLGALTACGDSFGDFDETLCQYDAEALSDLNPGTSVDYVGLRQLAEQFGTESEPPQVFAEWGVACDTAADAAACEAALADAAIDPALFSDFGQIAINYDIVTTSGDDVQRITDRGQLLELLGPIDTAHEAALVAMVDGHRIPCNEANVRQEGSSFVLLGTVGSTCGGDVSHYLITVEPDGTLTQGEKEVVEEGDDNCAIGRRPDGLCSSTHRARGVGAFFANAAHLEAASVYAFSHLARELIAHGAPRSLVRAALRARADEIRHARTTARLARRFGAKPKVPVVAARSVRPLFDVALDNATEGCVRETFGAATAHVQASTATDPAVRRAMKTIAREETQHASLSWAIDRWAQGRLSATERARIASRRADCVAELRKDSAARYPEAVQRLAGMPDVETSLRMIDRMAPVLWG